MDHEMTPEGESTAKWAARGAGFMGSVQQLIRCARCGGPLCGGYHKPRHVFDMMKPTVHFVCDECYAALPE
jgi:hypothetical protein